MNTKSGLRVVWAAVAGLGIATAVLGNQIPGLLITGHVTAASNGDWIQIDGRNYRIPAGSPVADAARAVAKGQWVDVRLSGPPTSAATVVINVAPHQD